MIKTFWSLFLNNVIYYAQLYFFTKLLYQVSSRAQSRDPLLKIL